MWNNVIDYRRTHIINENLLRESDKLLLMCDRSSWVYPLCWMCPDASTAPAEENVLNLNLSTFSAPFTIVHSHSSIDQCGSVESGRRWVIRRRINRAMEHTHEDYSWEDCAESFPKKKKMMRGNRFVEGWKGWKLGPDIHWKWLSERDWSMIFMITHGPRSSDTNRERARERNQK